MIVLKLGGSVITQKELPKTLDNAGLERAVTAIERFQQGDTDHGLVLVHGGGSYGHVEADDRDVSIDVSTSESADIRAIHSAMVHLNTAVLDRLADHDVGAIPVHPLSVCYRDSEGQLQLPVTHIALMVENGFVPVLHGDIIMDERGGASIVSGDELVLSLATHLDATRVGVCSTVPGVFDTDGEVIDRITDMDTVEAVLGGSDDTDVTGGMAGKVEALHQLEVPASIFGVESLRSFLAGEDVGTVVD